MKISSIIVGIILSVFIIPYAQSDIPYVIALGITQDGGYPHLGCEKECCERVWKDDSKRRFVVSLALVDPVEKKWWLFEATPDIREQLQLFRNLTKQVYKYLPEGIFITHAHIGHYSGLMQLGREVLNSNDLPVYILPGMKHFLKSNGPWSQLVSLNNILLSELKDGDVIHLGEWIKVQTFTVPHRDEFSETAGFTIHARQKAYLFIPDIDKWSKWNKDIIDMVRQVDIAFVDATFFEITELSNRSIEEIPHPLVSETMAHFKNEHAEHRSKIHFIHLNHTNKLLFDKKSQREVRKRGFNIAEQGKSY
jgi:pyrroloquinoline quinone biosynthesis protein B